jgi:hypothetical protein
MKTYLIALLTLAVSTPALSNLSASNTVLAPGNNEVGAKLELEFQQPDTFTDIRPANSTRAKFQQHVQHNFNVFFQEMASELPAGYSWKITITDIDLAGEVDYFVGGAGNPLRIVKDIYSPAIKFTHVLLDYDGEEIVSANEKLRDMGFMQSIRSANDNDPFRYEKQMLTDWFQKEIEPVVDGFAKLP